jgi:hypothetical protein
MGKLFGDMWNPAPSHYGNTPLVFTDPAEVLEKVLLTLYY